MKHKNGKLLGIITLAIVLDSLFRNTLGNILIFTLTFSILNQIGVYELITGAKRVFCESIRHYMCGEKPLHYWAKRVRVTLDEVSELVITDNNSTMFNGILNNVGIFIVRTGIYNALTNQ